MKISSLIEVTQIQDLRERLVTLRSSEKLIIKTDIAHHNSNILIGGQKTGDYNSLIETKLDPLIRKNLNIGLDGALKEVEAYLETLGVIIDDEEEDERDN